MVPPLRTESMAQFSAMGEPPCNFNLAVVTCWNRLPSASAPTASMATSAPRKSVAFFISTTMSSYSPKLYVSKVMMGAFATGAVSLAYPTIWQLSASMGPWRLGTATILSIAALIAWLIIEHKLWERPHSADERERAVLYNASTVVTMLIGVIIFHAGLFILLLLTAWWTLPPQMVAQNIGHPFGISSLLMMAWLVAAVATLGGALGSGMEDDEAVKAAAYGVRQRQRFDQAN